VRSARVLIAASIVASASWLVVGQQPGPSREDAYRQNNLGVAYLERYDYDAAAAAFRQALKIDPDLAMARLNLAIALLYDGEFDAAAAEARTAAAVLQQPHAHYVTGLIARAANRPSDAVTAFERVLVLDVEDAGARVQLGQLHQAERRFTDAVAQFGAALTREPFNATAAYGLATALIRGGQRAEGEAAMARFQALRDHPAAITYSTNYLGQGRYGEAISSTGLEADVVDRAMPAVTFSDQTRTAFGDNDPRGYAALADADEDGDLDAILTSSAGVILLTNEDGRFARRRTLDADLQDATGVVAGDYDNDDRPDVLAIGGAVDRLYHQESSGEFRRETFDVGPAAGSGPTRTAAFVDIDHDGDLDIFLSPPNRLMRNNGNRSFVDTTTAMGLAGTAAALGVIPTDHDNRRDIDLLILRSAAAPALFANQRDGTFRDAAADAGLPGTAAYTSAAAGDLNKDGAPDFVFAAASSPAVIVSSAASGRYAIAAGPQGSDGATALQLFDYDNDGLLDLLAFTPRGPRLWRHLGTSWEDATSVALPPALAISGDVPGGFSVGDVDRDGDYDVIARFQSGRLRFWRNDQTAAPNRSVRVRLDARVSNRTAAGAKVEMRAGSLRHRHESSAATPPAAPADIVFGLGRRARADVVRVLWPSGILQAETDPDQALTVAELDRKPSSCPFLFTWNGSRFEFVTDFLGGGEMGAWIAPGVRNVPDPDEYVRIRGDQLTPRNGRFELRVTNELEEAVFLDRVQLVAVTHPVGTDVYPDEGLRSSSPRPFTIYTTRNARPVVAAIDHHGHDVLDRLVSIDRRPFDDFRLESIQGYAEPHWLTLDVGTVAGGSPLRLLLTGWTDYAFSSDNVAAHQAGLPARAPSLQIEDHDGRWRTVEREIGIPAGRPQTVIVDLSRHVPDGGGRVRVRVESTLRVYWDQILVDTSLPAPYSLTRMDPVDAMLSWRGFSAEISPTGRALPTYDYARVSPVSPWKTLPGRYTRIGDVKPLLTARDDRFVVSAPGDQIALTFESDPFLQGWTRTYLLYADGFSKEMNLHSASPDRLAPLPFHAMREYPYLPPQHYPRTPAHDRYQAEYNTRVIGGPLPPMLPDGRAAVR
jgi:tetratricopeptide (TPR) repeat protein